MKAPPTDIRTASTLSARVYFDPALYAEQLERVLAPSFHVSGRLSDLQSPSSVHPLTFMPGSLDEPLLFAVDADDQVRCLSNVCTHRGNLVARESRKTKQLRCGYHGRCFDLRGRCVGMPGFEGVANFPEARDNLAEVTTHPFGPLLFSAIKPEHAFADWIAPVQSRTDFLPFDRLQLDPESRRRYAFDAHWALYVDNYLEGFHIPFVHPALARSLDINDYETEQFAYGNLQIGIAKADEPAFNIPAGHRDAGKRIGAYYFWLYPCTMLNFYPWGLSLNCVLPQGPSRTEVLFESYVWEPSLRQQGAGGDLHQVEMEDEAVVLTVQQGVRSRLYPGGRYSVRHEQNVHHFHQLLGKALALPAGP